MIIYIYTYTYTYIYINIYIYTHTHIYIFLKINKIKKVNKYIKITFIITYNTKLELILIINLLQICELILK